MSAHSLPRLATNYLRANLRQVYDKMARIRTLEAALGQPYGSWSRNPNQFMDEAQAMAPDADPMWFSSRNTGLVDGVFRGATEILGTASGEASAEEVAQNMIGGFSIGGGKKADVFGDLARKHGKDILSGRKSPKDLITTVYGWAKSRATDVWRKKKRRPDMVNDEALQGVSTMDVIDSNPNEVMLSLISGPGGRKFRNWIYQTIQRKGTEVQKVIIDASLDHMARTGDWPSANAILERVVEVKGSGISISKINQHRRKVEQLLADEMEKSPQVLDWADRYLDLAELGYGRGTLRAASIKISATRVANRFLGLTA
jgi:hypothetical protein